MLRAVRFGARFGFEIAPDTMAAIQKLHPADRSRFNRAHSRRVGADSLPKARPAAEFELLDASGLLADILPEVAAMKGVEQPPEFHPEGDVWIHTLMMMEGLRDPTPTLALGVAACTMSGKPGDFPRGRAHSVRWPCVELGERIARDIPDAAAIFQCRNRSGDHIALIANHMRFTRSSPKCAIASSNACCAWTGLRSTWSCIAWIAHRATGIWIITSSPRRSSRNRRRRCCVPRVCFPGDDLKEAGLPAGSALSRRCWRLWKTPSSMERFTRKRRRWNSFNPHLDYPEDMQATLVPVEEYLRTNYDPDCEYVDGQIVERNLGEKPHSRIQGNLILRLSARAKELGMEVLPEQRVQVSKRRFQNSGCSGSERVTPTNESSHRLPSSASICVLSKDDTMQYMQEKIDDYLDFRRALRLDHKSAEQEGLRCHAGWHGGSGFRNARDKRSRNQRAPACTF